MNRIKYFRENKGFSQAELAKELGISRVNIARYESGERLPKLPQLKKIATVLECSYLDLIDDESGIMEWLSHYLPEMKEEGYIYGYQLDYETKHVSINFNKHSSMIMNDESFKRTKEKTDIHTKEEILKTANYFYDMIKKKEDEEDKDKK